jgi:hypothetical protein
VPHLWLAHHLVSKAGNTGRLPFNKPFYAGYPLPVGLCPHAADAMNEWQNFGSRYGALNGRNWVVAATGRQLSLNRGQSPLTPPSVPLRPRAMVLSKPSTKVVDARGHRKGSRKEQSHTSDDVAN